MTLQQLKYIIEIVNCGSMNLAAQKLFVSQPSLSNAVKELEKELGIEIFIRTNKGVTLSSSGQEFLGYARQIIEQTELLEQRYHKDKPARRLLAVSTQHYAFSVNAFVNLIKEYAQDEYDFTLRETKTHEIIDDVKNMRSEIGVLYLSKFNEQVIRKILQENDLCFKELFTANPHVFLSAKHPLAGKKIVTFDDLEVQYLRAHINSTLVAPSKEKQDVFETNAKEFTYCLIQSWKQKLKYPFDQDKQLFENLLVHCRPAMLRFQHAIPIENPLLQTIKFQFKNTFNITKQCCKELSIQFNVEISEDEIGFLALHLANALDRNKRPLNTLLVSDNGLGVNELLIERINTLVPYIIVNRCVDILEVADVSLKDFDLILCTSDTLYIEDTPTVFIGSVLNESDIIRLNRIGYKYYKEINNPIIKIQNSK